MIRFCITLGMALLFTNAGWAHFNMLLPQSAKAAKGDKVEFVYQFGHPFEHDLFDAPRPTRVTATTPAGKTLDLTSTLIRFKKPGVDGKDVAAWKFVFTPEQRGDHWFVLETPAIWMEETKEFYQDTVQVVLHVQTQNGWEKAPGKNLWMAPLTRPYGLLPGMAFQSKVMTLVHDGKPRPPSDPLGGRKVQSLPGSMVEIERYNPQKPKEIPANELVTFKALTDPNGVFTCTLTEPGWWCMTAQRNLGTRDHDGKEYPVRQRVTLWVFVDKGAR